MQQFSIGLKSGAGPVKGVIGPKLTLRFVVYPHLCLVAPVIVAVEFVHILYTSVPFETWGYVTVEDLDRVDGRPIHGQNGKSSFSPPRNGTNNADEWFLGAAPLAKWPSIGLVPALNPRQLEGILVFFLYCRQ